MHWIQKSNEDQIRLRNADLIVWLMPQGTKFKKLHLKQCRVTAALFWVSNEEVNSILRFVLQGALCKILS